MLVFGYLGETGVMNASIGFLDSSHGSILSMKFSSEAASVNASSGSPACQMAFNMLRLIVTVGWAIYPLGYVLGYLLGTIDTGALNIIYNFADLINKTAFGVVIWAAAVQDSK